VAGGDGGIWKFTTEGALIVRWANSGSGDGQFSSPRDVAVYKSGNIYVADYRNGESRNSHPMARSSQNGEAVATAMGSFVILWV
jgi:hypothetical protein